MYNDTITSSLTCGNIMAIKFTPKTDPGPVGAKTQEPRSEKRASDAGTDGAKAEKPSRSKAKKADKGAPAKDAADKDGELF